MVAAQPAANWWPCCRLLSCAERCALCALQVGGIVSQAPDLSFPITNDSASTWLLTTYLDEDTRITRGDGGSVFILTKDTSSSISHMSPEQEAVAEAMML